MWTPLIGTMSVLTLAGFTAYTLWKSDERERLHEKQLHLQRQAGAPRAAGTDEAMPSSGVACCTASTDTFLTAVQKHPANPSYEVQCP